MINLLLTRKMSHCVDKSKSKQSILYAVSRCCTRGESEDHTGEKVRRKGSTLALKPRAEVSRSPKQGYQFPHKKDMCPPKTLKKKMEILHPQTHIIKPVVFHLTLLSQFPQIWIKPFSLVSKGKLSVMHSLSLACRFSCQFFVVHPKLSQDVSTKGGCCSTPLLLPPPHWKWNLGSEQIWTWHLKDGCTPTPSPIENEDVSRSLKQGYQWPLEKDLCPPKFYQKPKNKSQCWRIELTRHTDHGVSGTPSDVLTRVPPCWDLAGVTLPGGYPAGGYPVGGVPTPIGTWPGGSLPGGVPTPPPRRDLAR